MDAIANWIWQGSVVVLVSAAILRARSVAATTRYRVWWVTLAIVLAIPLLRFVPAAAPAALATAPSAAPFTAETIVVTVPEPSLWLQWLVVGLWLVWVSAQLGRTAIEVVRLRRARRLCRSLPEDRAARLPHWTRLRDARRKVMLGVSEEVRTAAVLGLGSPAIALSPILLRELSDEDLDRVVVHEWAHVQRRDDVARLVQVIARAIAGWHPAVWWIDRQLHLERETACDDWAVNVTGSARAYAACLTRLASLTVAGDGLVAPAALSSSDLTRRVVRLLDPHRSRSTTRSLATTALVSPVIVAVAVGIAGVQLVASATREPEPTRAMASLPAPAPIVKGEQHAATPEDAATSPVRSGRPQSARRPRTATPIAQPTVSRKPSEQTPPTVEPLPPSEVVAPGTSHASGLPGDLPGLSLEVPSQPATAPVSPWGAAADAGVGIGRGSQKAAVATAGFFKRLSKSIAGSF